MNLNDAKIINPSNKHIKIQNRSVSITAMTGSMWGKGNSCTDIILFPPKSTETTAELHLDFLPQFDVEQAGIVLFVDSDNYIKFVREMVDGKHVLILAKEIAGNPSPELSIPFESSATYLKLRVQSDSISLFWKNHEREEFNHKVCPNWFNQNRQFQAGLLVHGNNPHNQATFISFNIGKPNRL